MLQRSVSETRKSRNGRPRVSSVAVIPAHDTRAATGIRSASQSTTRPTGQRPAPRDTTMSSNLTDIEQARALVLECAAPLEHELVLLDEALDRTLARDIWSPGPIPHFDSSAMDGFALRCEDVRDASEQAPVSLELIGESRAGHPLAHTLG